MTIRTVLWLAVERADHAPEGARLSAKLSDVLRAVLIRAHEPSVGALGDLPVRLWDGLGAAGRGRTVEFVTGEIRDFQSIICSRIQVGRVVWVLGDRSGWGGISSMLVMVHVVLFLVVLEYLHLRVAGLRHERGTGLVGERHVVGILVGVVPGAIGGERLRLLWSRVARDVAMLMMLWCWKPARNDRVYVLRQQRD